MARRSSVATKQAASRPTKTVERRIGRPTALTDRVEDAILGYLMEGTSIEAACNLAGVTGTSFHRWMQRGEQARYDLDEHGNIPEEEDRFREFRERVLDARAQMEHRAVGVINKGMHGGFVTSEEPLLDLDGQPLRDDEGKFLYKRTYTAPDGRLALAYLQRARPKDWSVAGANLVVQAEISGPGGGSIEVGVEAGHVDNLVAQLAAVKERFAMEAAERAAESEGDVVEGEIVDG